MIGRSTMRMKKRRSTFAVTNPGEGILVDPTPPTSEDAPQRFNPLRLLPVVLIAAAVAAVFIFGLNDYISFQALRDNKVALIDWVNRWGFLAYFAFILIYAGVVTVLPPSGAILSLTSGFLFGTLWGGGVIVIGATMGATMVFLATRTAFADVLKNRAAGAVEKMRAGFQKNAVNYMLFLRLVPAFPFFVVNIVPGLLGVRLRTFVITTFFGIIPGSFVYASLGAGFSSLIDEREPDLGVIFEPQYLVPILGLAVLSVIPVIIKRLRKS